MAKKLVFSGEIGNELVVQVYKGNWSELFLCSDGGCIYCARAICDYLLAHEKKVIAVGQCMSATTAIIACGTPAVCTPNTRFMVHRSSVQDAQGGAKEMINHGEELQVWDDYYYGLLEQRTGSTVEVWKDLCREESCFGAKVALELGLVDEIL